MYDRYVGYVQLHVLYRNVPYSRAYNEAPPRGEIEQDRSGTSHSSHKSVGHSSRQVFRSTYTVRYCRVSSIHLCIRHQLSRQSRMADAYRKLFRNAFPRCSIHSCGTFHIIPYREPDNSRYRKYGGTLRYLPFRNAGIKF